MGKLLDLSTCLSSKREALLPLPWEGKAEEPGGRSKSCSQTDSCTLHYTTASTQSKGTGCHHSVGLPPKPRRSHGIAGHGCLSPYTTRLRGGCTETTGQVRPWSVRVYMTFLVGVSRSLSLSFSSCHLFQPLPWCSSSAVQLVACWLALTAVSPLFPPMGLRAPLSF